MYIIHASPIGLEKTYMMYQRIDLAVMYGWGQEVKWSKGAILDMSDCI